MLPLVGLRVLDLTRLLPGPFATMMLSDLGAEVIKVEPPMPGDYLRWVPPHVQDTNAGFAALNRNKKNVVVNLGSKEGAEVVRRLAAGSHVLVESFRAGYLERRGLGWETVREVNPRLVYCSMTGYGRTGPYAGRAGHDLNFLALSGLAAALRGPDGAPVVPPVQFADTTGGLMAVVSILAALREADRTGEGRHLDLSLAEACLAFTAVREASQLAAGTVAGVEEDVLGGGSPVYRYYRCRDGGWLAVGALEPRFRERLASVLGLEDLADDLLLPTPGPREAHERMERLFAEKTRDEWMAVLGDLDACVEPVLEPAEVASHPLAQARGWVREATMGDGEPVRQPASPLHPTFAPGETAVGRGAAPAGLHTREVLREAGYPDSEIEVLEDGGHVACAPSEIARRWE